MRPLLSADWIYRDWVLCPSSHPGQTDLHPVLWLPSWVLTCLPHWSFVTLLLSLDSSPEGQPTHSLSLRILLSLDPHLLARGHQSRKISRDQILQEFSTEQGLHTSAGEGHMGRLVPTVLFSSVDSKERFKKGFPCFEAILKTTDVFPELTAWIFSKVNLKI